jgi:hypothetical protein
MREEDRLVTFRGGPSNIQKQVGFAVIATQAVVAILLVGPWWFWLFLGLVVLSLPMLFLANYLVSKRNWFSLDDENRKIVMPFRQSLPYDRVKTINITEMGGRISVSAQKGKFDKISLVQYLNLKEKLPLTEELKRRFPRDILRHKSIPQWWISLGIYAPPIASALLLLGLTCAIIVKSPQILAVPQEKSWSAMEPTAKMRKEYELNRVLFSLPSHFRVVEEKKSRLVFESDTSGTALTAFL